MDELTIASSDSGRQLRQMIYGSSSMEKVKNVLRWMKNVLMIIFAWVVLMSLLPFLVLYSSAYLLYVRVKELIFLQLEDVRMTPQDSAWQTGDITINCLVFLNGHVGLSQLKGLWRERIASQPRFQKFYQSETTVGGLRIWRKEKSFRISEHMKDFSRTLSGEEELRSTLSECVSQKLPADLSPWQIIRIPMIDKTVLLFRFKHTFGDGIAFIRLFTEHLLDKTCSLASSVEPYRMHDPGKWFNKLAQFGRMAASIVSLSASLFRPTDINPLHGQELTGQKNVAWTKDINLKTVKQIKNSKKATVNDVLMSAIGGALADYLMEKHGESIDKITVYVPAVVKPVHGELILQNDLGIIPTDLHLGDLSPFERLAETKALMDRMKRTGLPNITAYLQDLSNIVLPPVITDYLYDNVCSRGTAVLSNVPGPQDPAYLGGHLVEGMTFFVPTRCNIGLGISMFSYNGAVRLAVMADKAILTDPEKICSHFNNNIRKMVEAL